ncbi:MAG TPA: amidase [Thauera sp.]|nr:amidase [Thauera sp.]
MTISKRSQALGQSAKQRGFTIPAEDLDDVAEAVAGLSATVAAAAAGLDMMQSDTDFAATLRELAPVPWEGPPLRSLGPASEIAAVQAVLHCAQRAATDLVGKLAWRSIDEGEATARAQALDAERAQGRLRGPLHGMPFGIKDMFDRPGRVAGWGSPTREGRCAAEIAATVVSRLEQAGAVVLGTLHMAEYAMSPTGLNASYGPGINPWNVEHVSGGSSSGSGMAVAAGHVPFALGSDTGGSVRLPAACCGVTGLKPTQYRLPLAGAMPLAPSLDCIGVLARSAELCGWVYTAMAGADPRDPVCLDVPPTSTAWMTCEAATLRVAVPRLVEGPMLSAAMLAAFKDAVDALRRAGVTCIAVDLPDLDLYSRLGSVMLAVESAAIHRQGLAARPGSYGRQVRRRLSRGLLASAMDYYDALRLRGPLLRRFVSEFIRDTDALLLPTMPDVAPAVATTVGDDQTRLEREFQRLSFWTRGTNYLGLPALSVPAGTGDKGLPLAVQFVGRPLAEDRILALGCCFQRATDWHTPTPRPN